jgi:hypothetical protein
MVCRVQELEEDLETTETKYTLAMQKYEKVLLIFYLNSYSKI